MVGFVIILVWCLLPVAWIISLSLKTSEETAAGSPQFLPETWSLQNYRDILGFGEITPGQEATHKDFLDALVNSFGISLIATALR